MMTDSEWQGLSKDYPLKAITTMFDSNEINLGIQMELGEHTDDKKVAARIAFDHLLENPKYYSKLKQAHIDEIKLRAVIRNLIREML